MQRVVLDVWDNILKETDCFKVFHFFIIHYINLLTGMVQGSHIKTKGNQRRIKRVDSIF